MLTTEAVLAEAFHLTIQDFGDIRGLWTMLSTGSVGLAGITHEELPEIHALMTKYRGRPMDFADATLVHSGRARIVELDLDHRPRRL